MSGLVLDSYGAVAPILVEDRDTVPEMRYSEELTHAAGLAAGKWMRSQQVAKRLREVAEECGSINTKALLELLAQEVEGGK